MIKKILFVLLLCLLAGAVALGIKQYSQSKITHREQIAMTAMKTQFANFVSTWDLALVPSLFVDNVHIKQVAENLVAAKQLLGKCQISTISPCVAGERAPESDEYISQYGHSISCPFTLSCEKESDIRGVCIYFVDNSTVKLYKFDLHSPDEE